MSFLLPSPSITFAAALRDLGSNNARTRALAAHALGDLVDTDDKADAVAALHRVLDDDSAPVRAEACASLGELGSATAVPALIARLADGDPAVRQNAAIALGSLRHPDGFVALSQALRDGPADLRFQAASSLAEIDPVAAYDILIAALPDADPQVVSAIALALGAIGEGRAVAVLSPLLKHDSAAVQFDAAYALAQVGSSRGRTILRNAISDETRGWDAASALELLGGASDVEAVVEAVTAHKLSPEVAVRTAGIIARLSTDAKARAAAIDLLCKTLSARKVHLRTLAVEEMGKGDPTWARDPLWSARTTRKGSEILDEIDAALARLATHMKS
jgi:HEAT repeat protein